MGETRNLSKERREKLLNKIKELRNFFNTNEDMDSKERNEFLNHLFDIEKEITNKKYGLVYEEHEEEIDRLLKTHIPVLTEDEKLYIDNGGQMNFILEGDNLASLKLLEKTHKGKIDVIYIDPPYNTGNKDFIYDDNFVESDDAYKDSKWISFIYKRIVIAKRLLSENGYMFISIDDRELANLKIICDEIFSENNFLNCICVKSAEATGVKMSHTDKKLPKMKEYLLVYYNKNNKINDIRIQKEKWDDEYKILIKNMTKEEIGSIKEIIEKEDLTEEDIKVLDAKVKNVTFGNINELFNDEVDDITKEKIKYNNAWRILRDVATTGGAKTIADKKKKNAGNAFFILTPQKKIYFIKNGYNDRTSQPRIKLLFADDYLTYNPGDLWVDIKTTGLDAEGGVEFLKGKKPIKLLQRIFSMVNIKNPTILDFFAGSGTTGEALLEYVNETNCYCNFILCTNSEATKNDPNKNIARDKTYQRIKTAITGKREDNSKYSDGLAGSLKYMKVDYIDTQNKLYEDYQNDLETHMKELLELQYGINMNDSEEYKLLLTEDDKDDFCDKIIKDIDKYKKNNKLKKVFIGNDILFDIKLETLHEELGVEIVEIPASYYEEA